MSALSELLRDANTAGLSARAVARSAQTHGHTMNHDTAARYLRGAHGTPDEETLLALADVFGVALSDLRTAAGLPAEVTEPYRPPVEASRLNRRQRRAVDEIIRSMLDVPAVAGSPESAAGALAARHGGVEPTTS